MFFPADDEIAGDQRSHEKCDYASQEVAIRGSGLRNPDGQSASAQAFQVDREFKSALVAAARILVQTLQDDLFRAHENGAGDFLAGRLWELIQNGIDEHGLVGLRERAFAICHFV